MGVGHRNWMQIWQQPNWLVARALSLVALHVALTRNRVDRRLQSLGRVLQRVISRESLQNLWQIKLRPSYRSWEKDMKCFKTSKSSRRWNSCWTIQKNWETRYRHAAPIKWEIEVNIVKSTALIIIITQASKMIKITQPHSKEVVEQH